MKKFTGTFASLAVITALASPAFAQDPQPTVQPQPQTQSTTQAPETQDPATRQQAPKIDMSTQRDDSATVDRADKNMVTGELVKVDTDLMEITIKGADDTEHTFRYADSTKVVGAEGQVSGLATKAGQLVTVHFTQGAGDSRIATKLKFDEQQ
jgi:hypothetical protein